MTQAELAIDEVDEELAQNAESVELAGARVAVQEYGVSPDRLMAGLVERGAIVTRVPVYQYALPEDLAPLEMAVDALARGAIDVVLFTTATQVNHLLLVAERLGKRGDVMAGLARAVTASIGPTTTEALQEQGLDTVDLLKLDCEGSEYPIIYESPRELWRGVRAIFLEVHDLPGEGRNVTALIAYLEDVGYRCTKHAANNGCWAVFAQRPG